MDVRESTHRRIEADLQARDGNPPVKQVDIDALVCGDHHHIAKDESPATRLHIGDWLEEHHDDPAFKV
jgi:UDP-2,3-diacylglucosamine pyrophosphatase LpxH